MWLEGSARRAAPRRRRAAVVEAAPAATRPSTPTTAARTTPSAAAAASGCSGTSSRTCARRAAREHGARLPRQPAGAGGRLRSHGEERRIELADRSTRCSRTRSTSGRSGPHRPTTPRRKHHETQTCSSANRCVALAVAAGFAVGRAGADRAQVQPHRPAGRRAAEGGRAVRPEGRAVHAGPLQGAGVSGGPARQRPQGRRAAAARRHRLHGDRHRHLRDAHPDAQPDRAAVHRRELPAGLEALRRVEVDAGAVRQGAGEGLPLPVAVRGRLPLHDDQGSAATRRPTPRARSCAASPTR